MNLQQLEYFQEIARTQNMTKSAERLHVSQPALSSTLKALENELGVSLFDRKGRTLVLNHTGQEFLKNVNSIFDILNRSRQHATIAQDQPWTEIVIGAMGAETALIPKMDRFLQDHPNVRFRVVSRTIISAQNADDTVDLLISPDPADHKGRQMTELESTLLMAVLPESDPLATLPAVALSQLAGHSFAFCTPASAVMPRTYNLCINAGFRPKVVFTADERFPVFRMLMQSGCVSILPSADAQLLASLNCGLTALPIEDIAPTDMSRHYISWRSLEALTPAAREFLQFLQS